MTELWQTGLHSLAQQFQTLANESAGLFHLFVETPDDKRNRACGPNWLCRPQSGSGEKWGSFQHDGPWSVIHYGNIPVHYPSFRAYSQGDEALLTAKWQEQNRVIRDKQGKPQAVFEPQRLRWSYLCNDAKVFSQFMSLATHAGRCLLGVQDSIISQLPMNLLPCFRQKSRTRVYVFGKVQTKVAPPTSGWNCTILQEDDGIVISSPEGDDRTDDSAWLLLLHGLGWMHRTGSPLHAERWCWEENVYVAYESARNTSPEARSFLPTIVDTSSYYSVLGSQNSPIDVSLASVWAIQSLLQIKSEQPKVKSPNSPVGEVFLSYAHKDKKWRDELITMLAPALRKKTIDLWYDDKIKPGQDWKQEIEDALERAKVGVLLVSKQFMASSFIANKELPFLIAAAANRKVKLTWVLLDECLYSEEDFAAIQALHDVGRSLGSYQRNNRDKHMKQIAQEIVTLAQS